MSWESEPLSIEDSVAYRTYRVARVLRRHLGGLASSNGIDLTSEQWFVLNRLRRTDGRSQTELSDSLFSDRPNMTRMLAKMEARGLLARRPDVDDKRRMVVSLTAEGRALHDEFAAVVRDARHAIFGGFAEADLERLMALLDAFEKAILAAEG